MTIKYSNGTAIYRFSFLYKGIFSLLKIIELTKLKNNVIIIGLEISEKEIEKIKSNMPQIKPSAKTIFGIDILPVQKTIKERMNE